MIYRVEFADGVGCYRCDTVLGEKLICAHCDTDVWPGPMSDGLRDDMDDNHLFAFPSMEELRDWFDGWFERMHEAGLRICIMACKKIIVGRSGKQLIFKREDAQTLGYRSLQGETND